MSFPAGSRYHEDIHDSPLSGHQAERTDAIVQLWTAQEALRRRPDGVLALAAKDITRNTAARHPSSHHHLWDWETREPLARYAVIPPASNVDNPGLHRPAHRVPRRGCATFRRRRSARSYGAAS